MRSVLENKFVKNLHNRPSGMFRGMFADALVTLICYFATFSARAVTARLNYFAALPFIIFIVVIIILSLFSFGAYYRLWSSTSGHEITLIFKAVAIATLITFLFDLGLDTRPLPLSVVLVANSLAISGYIAVRYRSRLISGASWRWKAVWKQEFPETIPETRVLIIGAGESGQTLAWRLKYRFPGSRYKVVGFIDDDRKKQNLYIEGCRVLGTRLDIVRIADTNHVDLIVVAVHRISGADFREILGHCEKTKALIKVVPNLLSLVTSTNHAAVLRDVEPEDLIGRKPITRSKDVSLGPITHKVILVTGAAGSIGSELSRQVMNYEPTKVILLDNNESGLHDLVTEIRAYCPEIDLTAVLADITIPEIIKAVFEKYHPQVVFHAAAYKHVPMLEHFPYEALRVNISGTLCVAKFAGIYDAERFVLISTDKAVNPSSIMGASKRVCELFLHTLSNQGSYKTLFTSVRFGNVLGSRGSVIPTFNRQIESGGPVTITDAAMTRYFMSIPEAVNLILHAACLTKGDDIYMLKMGEVVRIVELAERMIRMRGLRPNIDIPIKYTGIRPGEKLHEELYDQSEGPLETAHPNIIQLKSWDDNFDTAVFLGKIQRLLDEGPVSQAETYRALLAIIKQGRLTEILSEPDLSKS